MSGDSETGTREPSLEERAAAISRFSGILDMSVAAKLDIGILGSGAIGSNTAEQLARCGFTNLTLYDGDTVEDVNVLPQSFAWTDVGKPKVLAVSERIQRELFVKIKAVPERIEGEAFKQLGQHRLLILAVDNMLARRIAADTVFQAESKVGLLIDPRMGGLMGEIHIVPRADVAGAQVYLADMPSDREVVDLPCTERATPCCATAMGAIIATMVIAYVRNSAAPLYRKKILDFACHYGSMIDENMTDRA